MRYLLLVVYFFLIISVPVSIGQSDNCLNAELIEVYNECISQSFATFLLPSNSSTKNSCDGNTDDDVWYKFIALTEHTRIIVSSDQLANMAISVFETCTKEIACVNEKDMGGQEFLLFDSQPGREYLIQVYDFGVGGGGFLVCVTNYTPCDLEVELGPPIWVCEADQVVLESTIIGNTVDIQYQWRSLDENDVFLENPRTAKPIALLPLDLSGQLSVELKVTTNNCEIKDTLYIGRRCVDQEACPTLVANITTSPIKCFTPNSGAIEMVSVVGGSSPYVYQMDAASNFQSNPTFQNLEEGQHHLLIQDGNGCQLDTFVDITNAFLPTLDIGPDISVPQGASVKLEAISNFSPDQIQQVVWSIRSKDDCPSPCLSVDVTALRSDLIEATIETVDNCIAKDTMRLSVQQNLDLYIPSAFSPNNDGINDFFTIFAGAGIATITTLRIFDRWGNLVFHQGGFLPNEPSLGWDGRFNQQSLDSGLFLFYAELEVIDSPSLQKTGAVFLVR